MPLWNTPGWLRGPAIAVLLVAVALVVIGLTTPSPTVTGGTGALDRDDAVRGILRVTRHPFLCGVALWAALHLILNGDAAALVLFGALLVLALIGPSSIDAKRQRAFGARWDGSRRDSSCRSPPSPPAATDSVSRRSAPGGWRWRSWSTWC